MNKNISKITQSGCKCPACAEERGGARKRIKAGDKIVFVEDGSVTRTVKRILTKSEVIAGERYSKGCLVLSRSFDGFTCWMASDWVKA